MELKETNTPTDTLNALALVAFLQDLILLTTFAQRKGVSKDAVYHAIDDERINEKDLIWIDKVQFIRWSQYKDITFRKRTTKRKPPIKET